MTTVKDIQAALLKLGHYKGDVDGVWGPKSRQALKDFQTARGFIPENPVLTVTLAALIMEVAHRVHCVLPPNGLAAIKECFGDFKYRQLSGVNIDIDDTWENDNLVRLRDVCGTGLSIRLHRKVEGVFIESLTAAMRAAPKYKVRMLGGYCERQMKTLDPKKQARAPLSTHAWGISFDINWDKNPFSKVLKTDLPPAFVEAFTSRGWNWGGAWKNSKDAMHFQFCTGY